MSDYFAALMRSSGMAFGADASSQSARTPVAPPDYGIEEVDEQVSAAPGSPLAQPQRVAPLGSARNLNDPAPGAGTVSSAMETAASRSLIDGTAPATFVPSAAAFPGPSPDSMTAHRAPADHMSTGQGESSPSARKDVPPAGPALVQAALRWIAAGEDPISSAPEAASRPVTRLVTSDVSEETSARGMTEFPPVETAVQDMPQSVTSTTAVRPVRAQPIESLATIRNSDEPRQAVIHDHARDEVIEVSIGSIHVRVDAPSPPALAQTAPTPASRPTAEPPPRSGLSRRVLWRI